MKIRLETLANVTILVTGVVVTTLVVSRLVAERQAADRPTVQQYKVGDRVTASEFPVDLSRSPQTLLLVLNSNCHFCTESTPFYRDLVAARGPGTQVTRVVVVGVENVETLQGYLARQQIAVDEVRSIRLTQVKIRGTPTLLLLDRSGSVKGVWPGYLTDEQRKTEIIKLVKEGHA
jgi:hypothetical protein